MDLKNAPKSTRVEDRTGEILDPMVLWLLKQPTTQTGLTPREIKTMNKNDISITDMYFARAIKAHKQKNILNPNVEVPTLRDDFFNEYGYGADHPFQKVKK